MQRMARKFNGKNVWRISSFQGFGRKKFGEWTFWMVLVANWRIADKFTYVPLNLPAL